MKLYKGDCLEVMKQIPNGSIDSVITDPPYGTTACKWDSVIAFDLMWEQLNRIIKPNGAIVLFGSEPFSSALRMSNIKNYKYDWIWEKERPTNFLSGKKTPLKYHELIHLFGGGNYYPQYTIKKEENKRNNKPRKIINEVWNIETNKYDDRTVIGGIKNWKYPNAIIKCNMQRGLHPTQKPVALMEYIIKTYTKENETVLDFTMGSGSTGVACVNTNRNFIGIEMDEAYFDIATKRINEAQLKLF
jgi:site-specific DNA-methyltransferase (adenine-specific)